MNAWAHSNTEASTVDLNKAKVATGGHAVQLELISIPAQVPISFRDSNYCQYLEQGSIYLGSVNRGTIVDFQREKEHLETILSNSPDAILLLSPSGAIKLCNEAFTKLFGHKYEQVRGQSLCLLFEKDSMQTYSRMVVDVLKNSKTRRAELIALRKDASIFEVEIALAPVVKEGIPTGMVGTIRDISALKQAERMKEAFVSNVSHELRGPIANMKLIHRILDTKPEQKDEFLEQLDQEICHLNTIIEGLLRLSRLDQGKVSLQLSPLDLSDLVYQYKQNQRLDAQNKCLQLSYEEDLDLMPVLADRELLGQALSILLTNAINYTPSGGRIHIFTRKSVANGGIWSGFGVEDTGPGISKKDIPYLFERFYRGKAGQESDTPGTGLGLAIAKEIVDRHKGRIEIENMENGSGARFTVWLPAVSESLLTEDRKAKKNGR